MRDHRIARRKEDMEILEKRNPNRATESATVRFAVNRVEYVGTTDEDLLTAALEAVHETRQSTFGAEIQRYINLYEEYRILVIIHKD